jgi:Undecaprenyl-phosphate glucose phosphotransferase
MKHFDPALAETPFRLDATRASPAPRRRNRRLAPPKVLTDVGFGYLAAAGDVAAILLAAAASHTIYGLAAFGLLPPAESVLQIGFLLAGFVALINAQRGEYEIQRYGAMEGGIGRRLSIWNIAFLCVFALGFFTKTTEIYSRGAVAVLYLVGFLSLGGVRVLLAGMIASARKRGALAPRRLVLVGLEDELKNFIERYDLGRSGMKIVSSLVIRENEGSLRDDLALAAAAVRILRPDDVFIAAPWSKTALIEACVDALHLTPAAIHIGPEEIFDRFADLEVGKLGPIASLNLTRRPLTSLQLIQKRLFDIVAASAALVLLAPLLSVVALLIKLDSPGPVFFLQRRYGFNQEPFRIFKFRTMRTMEDGAVVKQATRNDPRVTRIGAVLRRHSIDELPQLLNVLIGNMSLIGPRPHALAHDRLYEQRIARYARRHNVKPGITGWAQVHGFRGEIATDEAMRGRVEHDLYYIDNWSFLLDLKIVLLTVFSPKTHAGAY